MSRWGTPQKSKLNPYRQVVATAVQLIKKRGYVTDRDLDNLFDKYLLPAIGPFVPSKYKGDVFDSDFLGATYNHLEKELKKIKGLRRRDLKDPDDIHTVYALNSRNLNEAYKIEQSGIAKKRENLSEK